MTTFHSIDELLKMMSREQLLLKQMFGKRKQQSFRREYALELTEYKLQRIQSLIDHGVLRENGSFLEMEDIYLHFFEQVLEDAGVYKLDVAGRAGFERFLSTI